MVRNKNVTKVHYVGFPFSTYNQEQILRPLMTKETRKGGMLAHSKAPDATLQVREIVIFDYPTNSLGLQKRL